MRIKLIIGITAAFFLASCKNTKDLKGQYEGVLLQNGLQKDVVAFVADKSLKRKSFEVVINELNISKQPMNLLFELDKDNEISFTHNNKNYYLEFEKDENCISSYSKNVKFNLCLDKNKLNLNFEDLVLPSNSFKISVTKNSESTAQSVKNEYSVEELLGRAKFLNFTLEQNAENLFRSRQQVKSAIGNLLPKLNAGTILGFATGSPEAFVGAVGNLAPFLFPSNWYQFKEAKELLNAEKKSYASMRGNILNGVEGLLYVHLRNVSLVKLLSTQVEWLGMVLENVKMKEEAGTVPQGTSELFAMKIGAIELDLEQLNLYVQEESTLIASSVNIPVQTSIVINPPALPELSTTQVQTADACVTFVSKNSFELISLDFMITASKYQTEERIWSFLDPNGGGIGFGNPSSIRIGQSYERELQVKRQEILSQLNKGCSDTTNESNTAVRSYKLSTQYLAKAYKIRDILSKRILLGDSLNENMLDELADNAEEIIKYEAQKIASQYEYLISTGKFNRLMLTGYYANLEVGL